MRRVFDLLILDEAHEYRAGDTAQGVAAGTLAEVCGSTLALTGTLLNGYSSSLFWLLWRFDRKIRELFDYDEMSRWVDLYGFRTWERRLSKAPRRQSRYARLSGLTRHRVRERPGINPRALFHLLPHCVFLRLSDVAEALPPYEEEVEELRMEQEQHRSYLELATALRDEVGDLRRSRVGVRLLATYLQALLTYPDACTAGERVYDPEDLRDLENLVREVPGISPDPADHPNLPPIVDLPPLPDITYPKEQALIDIVREEHLAGRRVMVYVTHTGRRDITPRLNDFLTKEGFRVEVLKANTVPAEFREEWVARQVADGDIDVLICHPRLVQTGLDLIDFPTIVHYETEYSVYAMRQASRRSWRIGQTEPVRVIFLSYRGTMQSKALSLVAAKMHSSLIVEGELPEDGLASLGDTSGEVFAELVKALVEGKERLDGSLEAMFAERRDAERESDRSIVTSAWDVALDAHPDPDTGRAEAMSSERAVSLELCDRCHSFAIFDNGVCVSCAGYSLAEGARRSGRAPMHVVPPASSLADSTRQMALL